MPEKQRLVEGEQLLGNLKQDERNLISLFPPVIKWPMEVGAIFQHHAALSK